MSHKFSLHRPKRKMRQHDDIICREALAYAFSCIREDVFSGLKIQICEEVPLLFHAVNE